MMLWARFYLMSVGMALISAAPHTAGAQQEVLNGPSQREVALDPVATHHPVTVVGGFGVGTNIQFPDSFEENNVLCGGQCIIVKPGDGEAVAEDPALAKDPRNWVMEIVPGARVISLRPKHLPKNKNPADGFTTNVFVKLDGGHVVNLTVRLLSLRDGESHPDGLVILQLPQAQTLDGKLKSEKDELERGYDDRLRREVSKHLAKNLGEGVRCRKIDWFAKSHRQDDVSLFIRELCGTQGASKFFWVVFDVHNRGDRSVHLQAARLEAVDDVEKPRTITDHYFFQKDPIYFEEQARGVATAAVAPKDGDKTALVPQRWELTVLTKSGVTLKADNLVF